MCVVVYMETLVRCRYGTRDAAHLRENCYSDALVEIGFVACKASPCCFYHPLSEVSVVVHGHDFNALGCDESLDAYEQGLKKHFEIKLRGRLGTEKGDDREIRILNKIHNITESGLTYEAVPRHVEMLARDMGLADGKSVVIPSAKEPYDAEEEITEYTIKPKASEAIHNLLRPAKSAQTRHLRFNDEVEYYNVCAYCDIYGAHAKDLVRTRHGFMQKAKDQRDLFTAKNAATMARRRPEMTFAKKECRIRRTKVLKATRRVALNGKHPWQRECRHYS